MAIFHQLQKSLDKFLVRGVKGEDVMSEWVLLLVVLGIWIVLQTYVLPKLGVST